MSVETVVVTLRQAAEILDRPWWTLRTWVSDHKIRPLFREGNPGYYPLDALLAMNFSPERRRNGRRDDHPSRRSPSKKTLKRLYRAMQDVMAGENPAGPMKRSRRDVTELIP